MRNTPVPTSAPRRGVVAALVTLLLVAVAFGGYRLLNPRGELGTCFVLSDMCRNVPMSTIERYSGLQFPPGTRTEQSTARIPGFVGFRPAFVSAVLQLPPHGAVQVVGYGLGLDWNGQADTTPYEQQLRAAGATHIRVDTNGDGMIVLTGRRDGHRMLLVYVNYHD
jgi:hypothetical protein